MNRGNVVFEDKAFVLLVSIFAGVLVISAVLASKIITVFGLIVPAGVLAYSIPFLVANMKGFRNEGGETNI